MPRPDRARAELTAIRRAALSPERHVMEGELYDSDAGAWDLCDRTVEGERLGNLLFRLEGKRVRITIEVLPNEGATE